MMPHFTVSVHVHTRVVSLVPATQASHTVPIYILMLVFADLVSLCFLFVFACACATQLSHNPPLVALGCCRHGGRPKAADGSPAKKDTLANIEETK